MHIMGSSDRAEVVVYFESLQIVRPENGIYLFVSFKLYDGILFRGRGERFQVVTGARAPSFH